MDELNDFIEGVKADCTDTAMCDAVEQATSAIFGCAMVESVVYVKGHKDSNGNDAPWTIKSHETGEILSSHPTKEKAEEHLAQMHYFKHKGQ